MTIQAPWAPSEPVADDELPDLAAVAGRAGEQAHVARERLRGGEVDGLRERSPAASRCTRGGPSSSSSPRAGSRREHLDVLEREPRRAAVGRASVVTSTSTRAPATTACGEPVAITSTARSPALDRRLRRLRARARAARRVTGAARGDRHRELVPGQRGGERRLAGRRVARGQRAHAEVGELERPPRRRGPGARRRPRPPARAAPAARPRAAPCASPTSVPSTSASPSSTAARRRRVTRRPRGRRAAGHARASAARAAGRRRGARARPPWCSAIAAAIARPWPRRPRRARAVRGQRGHARRQPGPVVGDLDPHALAGRRARGRAPPLPRARPRCRRGSRRPGRSAAGRRRPSPRAACRRTRAGAERRCGTSRAASAP